MPGVHEKARDTRPRRFAPVTFCAIISLLARMTGIVHAADVAADIDTDPVARGLEAVATGYNLRFPEDKEDLARQFQVYDALYAWCRWQVTKGQ